MKEDIEIVDDLKGNLALAVTTIEAIAEAVEIDLDETKINARGKNDELLGSVSIAEMVSKWKELSKR